jgi:hypothetical protein
MEIITTPKVLQNLNNFEKLLIQLNKCFLTIVKLKTFSYNKNLDLLSALKGLAIHLPVPIQKTHNYLSMTLPSIDNIKIFVDALPNKNNIVFRSLVEIEKVYDALNFLILHNPLYKHVKIDENYFENLELSSIFINNKENPSILIQENDDYENYLQTNFSIISLNQEINDETDIEKYSNKRIQSEPVNTKDTNLDHLCFPHLFPYGRGGVYDQRSK